MSDLLSHWIRHWPWMIPLGLLSAAAIWWHAHRAGQPSLCTWCPWIFWASVLLVLPSGVDDFAAWAAQPKNIPILASVAVPPLAFLLADLAIVLLAGPFWRPVRVFVSFAHSREEQARVIEERMRAEGLEVTRMPFNDAATHTTLLTQIRLQLRRCDAVICLPGSQTSFVDGEILAASTMNKAIVFVVEADSSRLPNTALYGYPAFRLEKLASRQYRPLGSLLKLACGHFAESCRFANSVYNIWNVFPSAGTFGGLFLLYGLLSCFSGALVVAAQESPSAALLFILGFPLRLWEVLGMQVFQWILLGIVVVGMTLLLIGLRNVQSVLRQSDSSDTDAFARLRDCLGRTTGGRRILVCLMRKPLQAHHEASPSEVQHTSV